MNTEVSRPRLDGSIPSAADCPWSSVAASAGLAPVTAMAVERCQQPGRSTRRRHRLGGRAIGHPSDNPASSQGMRRRGRLIVDDPSDRHALCLEGSGHSGESIHPAPVPSVRAAAAYWCLIQAGRSSAGLEAVRNGPRCMFGPLDCRDPTGGVGDFRWRQRADRTKSCAEAFPCGPQKCGGFSHCPSWRLPRSSGHQQANPPRASTVHRAVVSRSSVPLLVSPSRQCTVPFNTPRETLWQATAEIRMPRFRPN